MNAPKLTAAQCRALFKSRAPVSATGFTVSFPRGKKLDAVAVAVLVTQLPGFALTFDGKAVVAEMTGERYEIEVAI